MGLKTRPMFYYGHEIPKNDHYISINEGSGALVVNLSPSGYTFSELAVELSRALNEAGALDYTVTTNRTTRKFTITATANFSILAGSGAFSGSQVFQALGFNAVDKTGASTYTSDNATGTVWRPQLPPFAYTPSSLRESSLQAVQQESGSGDVEVISFGTVNYAEMEFKYITSRFDKPDIVELDRDGLENARLFLSYLRKKNRVEFMEDRDDPSVFEKFLLSKTAQSSNGLEFKLSEMTSQNIQDYYETGLLTFRKVL